MSMGVPKSANTRMNTSREEASTVGSTSGRMMPVTRWKLLAPRLSAASFRELSKFCNAPQTYMYTSGKDCKEKTSTIPAKP